MLDRLPLACLQLAILGLLLLALGRLPGAWRAWGWRLVLLKAAILLVGAFSLPWLSKAPQWSPGSQSASGSRTLRPPEYSQPPATTPTKPPFPALPPPDPTSWLLVGWLGGATILITRRLWRARFRIGPLAPVPEAWKVKTSIKVKISATAPAPMIVGLIRPTVVLPAWEEPPAGWQAALAHELAHARRRDVLWDALIQGLAALFWFHPVAWFAIREHRLACEEACDAEAIQTTNTTPRDYAITLVHLGRPTPAGLALGAPGRALSRRIHAMHRRSLAPRWALPFLAIAVLAAIPLELTAAPPDQTEVPVSSFDHIVSSMIERPSVRKELGLTSEDLKRTRDAGMALYPKIRTIGIHMAEMKKRNVPVGERIDYETQAKRRWYAETSAAILGELTPIQVARLRQITLQRYGALALQVPEIARASGVSTPALRKITQLRKEADREMLAHAQDESRKFNAAYRAGLGLTAVERKRLRTLEAVPMDLAKQQEYRVLSDKLVKAIRSSQPNQVQALDRVTWAKYSKLAEAALSPEDRRKWTELQGKPVPRERGEGHLF